MTVRVCLVSPYSLSVPGGVQGQVLGLARALREGGTEAWVVAPCDGPPPERFVTSVGRSVQVPSNGSMSPIASSKAAASRTFEALRSFDPDVVHLHEPAVPGPTHAALMGTSIPAVGTFHSAADEPHAALKLLRKPAVRLAARLAIRTAVSEEARRTAEEALGGHYWVIPNGVELAVYTKAVPWPSEHPSILFVGRHEERKGLRFLLEAFRGLDRPGTELWVAGEGPETEELKAWNVPGVQWLGRISDEEKARRLRAATVYCCPAIHGESFGLVVLEGMAAGVALVASDIPGFRNVARPDVEALMAAPGDPVSLRNALRRLLDDPARRRELVEAGRKRACEFSMEHLAERYLPLYETAVALAG